MTPEVLQNFQCMENTERGVELLLEGNKEKTAKCKLSAECEILSGARI